MRPTITIPRMFLTKGLKFQDFSKWFHGQLVISWKAAAREFFLTVAHELAKQGVIDTGMSAASMEPLATKVRAASLIRGIISGARGGQPKKGYTTIDGVYVPDSYKSMIQGVREARSRGGQTQSITFGTPMSPVLKFTFEIVVFQWSFWEKKRWHSLEKGEAAFLAKWDEEIKKRVKSKDLVAFFTGRG